MRASPLAHMVPMILRSLVFLLLTLAVAPSTGWSQDSPKPPVVPPELDPVEARKGQLHLPLVFGQTQLRFGTQPATASKGRVRHTGWTIVASPKHRVRAVLDGRVVHVERLRGYGLTVVIDHGHGYHSVYSHLKKAQVAVGDAVEWGAPLGTIGSTGSLDGVKLYFELRHEGRPIDPAGWFLPARELRRRLQQ